MGPAALLSFQPSWGNGSLSARCALALSSNSLPACVPTDSLACSSQVLVSPCVMRAQGFLARSARADGRAPLCRGDGALGERAPNPAPSTAHRDGHSARVALMRIACDTRHRAPCLGRYLFLAPGLLLILEALSRSRALSALGLHARCCLYIKALSPLSLRLSSRYLKALSSLSPGSPLSLSQGSLLSQGSPLSGSVSPLSTLSSLSRLKHWA